MKYNHTIWFLVLMTTLMLSSCQTEYEKMVHRELASGVRHDSLFLGLSLGMSSKDFFAHCWELNKQKVIRQGTSNVSVLYDLTQLKDTADMNFYPTFYRDSIFEMPVLINYKGWSPWNKHLSNDSLLSDVLRMLKQWYGGNFIKINYPDIGTIYVKVDGNRRIMVSRVDDAHVKVIYTDLIAEKRKEDDPADEE